MDDVIFVEDINDLKSIDASDFKCRSPKHTEAKKVARFYEKKFA